MSEPNQEPELPVESEAPPAIPDLPAEPPGPTEDPLATRLVQLEYEALTLSHRAEELGQTIASVKRQVVVLGGVVVFLLLASGGLAMWVSSKVAQALAPKPPVEQPLPVITFAHWRQGQPPVRLIHKSWGYCYLTLVAGKFMGGGEIVRVWIGDDGYWYLGGQSGQEGVTAECAIVTYPPSSPSGTVQPPQPFR